MSGVLGGASVGGGVIWALVAADLPLAALMTGVTFGLMGALGAWVRLRRRWRCRSRGMRLPPLTGNRFRLAVAFAALWAVM